VFQIVIRTTFPVRRIVGYQEHALRDAQPRQQHAKADAADSNSSAIAEFFVQRDGKANLSPGRASLD
jgi:hypothetical protein